MDLAYWDWCITVLEARGEPVSCPAQAWYPELMLDSIATLDTIDTKFNIDRMRSVVKLSDHGRVPRTPELPSARVEADLRRRLVGGEWSSGEPLPTVSVLAEHYGVSRGTVARALRALAEEDLVRIVARWGTFRT